MSDMWNFEWEQEWNNFNPKYLVFVTDENILIDNIEKKMEEANFNVDLAVNMLEQIGVKFK